MNKNFNRIKLIKALYILFLLIFKFSNKFNS